MTLAKDLKETVQARGTEDPRQPQPAPVVEPIPDQVERRSAPRDPNRAQEGDRAMDKPALIEALSASLQRHSSASRPAAEAEIRSDVLPILLAQEEFAGNRKYIVRRSGKEAFTASEAAQSIAHHLVRLKDPVRTVHLLEELFAMRSARLWHVRPLYGITVSGKIEIEDDLFLIRFTDLAWSRQKEEVIERTHGSGAYSGSTQLDFEPSCALVHEETIDDFITDGAETHGSEGIAPGVHPKTLDEVTLCLPVAVPCPVSYYVSWTQFGSEAANLASASSYSESAPQIQTPISHLREITPNDVSIVAQFLSLDAEVRTKLRVPLDHLNRAMMRNPYADMVERAID